MEERDFESVEDLYETICQEVGPFMVIANEAFESGAAYAYETLGLLRSRLNGADVVRDPWYESHCVRIAAKQVLKQYGLAARDYRLDNLAMSGLRVFYGGWELRTRKSVDGGVPRLNIDGTIRAFCQQSLPGEFGEMPRRHLFLLYHMNSAGRYTGLSLVYPEGQENGIARALVRVDYPAQSFSTNPSIPPWSDTVPEAGDLDLELDEGLDEENGEEQAQ